MEELVAHKVALAAWLGHCCSPLGLGRIGSISRQNRGAGVRDSASVEFVPRWKRPQ